MNANVNKRSFRIERMPFEMQRAIEHLPTFFGVMLSGRVDAKLRERVLLAVSGANRCRYCAFVHGLWAKRVGVEASEVERLAAGESGPDEELAIELARDFVASGGTLSAEARSKLSERYGAAMAKDIEGLLNGIDLANLNANTFDAFLDKLKGKSNWLDPNLGLEALVFHSFLGIYGPLLAAIKLSKKCKRC